MFKSKDLYGKNVYDANGLKLGQIKDIVIDFYNGKVLGVVLLQRKGKISRVRIENISKNGNIIIVNKSERCEGILLSQIYNMEVIDKMGREKGIVEDIIIKEESYDIKGLILDSGKINSLIKGKEIILLKNIVLADGYILCYDVTNVVLKNISHEINLTSHIERA